MKKWLLPGALLVILLLISVFLINLPSNKGSSVPIKTFGVDVPLIQIELGSMGVEEFRDSWKDVRAYDGTLTLESSGTIRKYGDIEVSGRGNSSWMTDKKPFQVKLGKKSDFLNLGKAKKWVYVPNAYDKSFMRNDVAYILAEMLGENTERRGRYAEVILDDSYEGLYYVMRKVEIGKGAVDLRDIHGLLVELDNVHNEAEVCYHSLAGNCVVLQDSVAKDDEFQAEEAMRNFMKDFNQLEVAAEKGDYEKVEKLIDVKSFVDYYLVNEFTVNPDAYSSSFYMYRDGEGDKIHAGPVWDFDLAFGNKAWPWTKEEMKELTTRILIREDDVFGKNGHEADLNTARLFYYLMKIPEFKVEVGRVFVEKMSGKEPEIEAKVVATQNMIDAAAKRDGSRWPDENARKFDEETEELLQFIRERYSYFEEVYGIKNHE